MSVGTSIGTDHFGLIRPEYSGPALKVLHFDRSGYLVGRPEITRSICQNCFPQYRCFGILLTRTITKSVVAWFGSVQPECTVSLGIRRISEISSNRKAKAPLVEDSRP